MPRPLKQLLYAILYLVIIGFVVFGAYSRFLKPAPSCFDHIQNQGEQGIDCGPVCGNYCTGNLAPVSPAGPVSVFLGPNGRVTLLARIANPNADFGAVRVPYEFQLYGTSDAYGEPVLRIRGNTFLYPGEVKYVAAVNEAVRGDVQAAGISVASSAAWTASSSMGLPPRFAFQNLATAPLASDTIAVSGNLVNQEPMAFAHVEVIALFVSSNGAAIGTSETELDNVPAAGAVPVSVSYLADSRIDPTKTEMYAYALR